MYEFVYYIIYKTFTIFLDEEDSRHGAKVFCLIFPLFLIGIVAMFVVMNKG